MNTANPGPSGPPPTTAPIDDLLEEIKLEEALDKGALASARVVAVRSQILPLLDNKRAKREELKQLTMQVRKGTEDVMNDLTALRAAPDDDNLQQQLETRANQLEQHRLNLRLTHVEFDALRKATKREINSILRGAKRDADKRGLVKLSRFYGRLGELFNSPEAAWPWENRNAAPATAGAN